MKTSLLILTAGLFATSAWAQDSNLSQTQRRQYQPPPARRVVVQPKNGEGSIQKGIRSGNVFQMINPFAPMEYGSGSEYVYSYENDSLEHGTPGKELPKGIRLFGFTF